MGIRKKIFLGFVIIGLILFASGMISLFQLIRIEKAVADMNVNNIRSIEASGRIFEAAKTQTWKILDIMHENSQGEDARIVFNDTLYEECFEFILQNASVQEERYMFDTLYAKYQLFRRQTILLDSLFLSGDMKERNECFNTFYRPVYESFTKAANKMGIFSQNTISKSSVELKNNFYRLVIPLIVAVTVGLLLVMLFNYFINFYFINPILKIIRGIKGYSENKQTYNVKVDTRDEINELNKEIKLLISHTKQKESAGVFNFNK
ncbi:MAG: MCP four helix bundle domain-containing protein [Prevotellaceae bacterium]|jgi:methyl-accepting chemotaxis protein|nr:MCP four helix bundle domain-containing protein [Prevotellaceae bacterium]